MSGAYNSDDKILVAIDCIIFGFDKESLKILLIKRDFEPQKGHWSLMGGFLKKNETLDQAANRTLLSLTGVQDIYMEQLYAFSEVDRDPVERTLSVSYYALINIEDHNEKLTKKYNAQWFDIADAPSLIFDHDLMLQKAIRRLRRRTAIKPVGFDLLPEKFTMRQLQKLYEAILDKEVDKRNFINKINSLDILIKLNEKDMTSSTKGSFLYKFSQEKYDDKLKNNFYIKL
ncbi:DNA mismatch repair protein MutT [Polaribacter pacificus]|uniref:DNA mismatch repair protein MutT n=1 Tax=Polaribacter pacificus TaxID=1775173 RepID=A0A917MAS4_9FLAO|nr:NUDIX domain-containing protein [Polaribacter pacificus]GGG88406.1 DNA mismatch repair protein MutT [Polaribacter pacificus]